MPDQNQTTLDRILRIERLEQVVRSLLVMLQFSGALTQEAGRDLLMKLHEDVTND